MAIRDDLWAGYLKDQTAANSRLSRIIDAMTFTPNPPIIVKGKLGDVMNTAKDSDPGAKIKVPILYGHKPLDLQPLQFVSTPTTKGDGWLKRLFTAKDKPWTPRVKKDFDPAAAIRTMSKNLAASIDKDIIDAMGMNTLPYLPYCPSRDDVVITDRFDGDKDGKYARKSLPFPDGPDGSYIPPPRLTPPTMEKTIRILEALETLGALYEIDLPTKGYHFAYSIRALDDALQKDEPPIGMVGIATEAEKNDNQNYANFCALPPDARSLIKWWCDKGTVAKVNREIADTVAVNHLHNRGLIQFSGDTDAVLTGEGKEMVEFMLNGLGYMVVGYSDLKRIGIGDGGAIHAMIDKVYQPISSLNDDAAGGSE